MGHGRRGGARREEGVALVEFALALPFLAILAFGTIDLGRVYLEHERVKNAAREAALYVRANPGKITATGTCTGTNNAVWHANHERQSDYTSANYAVQVQIDGVTKTGCDPSASAPSGAPIRVEVSRDNFKLFTPIVQKLVGRVDVSSHVTVRGR